MEIGANTEYRNLGSPGLEAIHIFATNPNQADFSVSSQLMLVG